MIPILKIEALTFQFDLRRVFENYSLDLFSGITWLRGNNGTGKTTLMRLIAGSLSPSRGTIRLLDFDIAKNRYEYRLQCFYCGTDRPNLPWLCVEEFLDLHVALYPMTDHKILDRHLASLKITNTLSQPMATLSLGQHKKVQLVLALSLPVHLLLLDEPFNGLDKAAVEYLREELTDLVNEKSMCILLTSHLEPNLPLADEVVLDTT